MRKGSLPVIGRLNRYFNWLKTINTAEPEMNPAITGRLSNWARNPRRSKPQASRSRPEPNASVAARVMYSAEPGVAIGDSTE